MNDLPVSNLLEQTLEQHCAAAGAQLQTVCLHALAGGGRTRARLLLQASEREDTHSVQAACALEMMHAATLLQDDIFDRSAERRGCRAAYLEFGEAQAVLASDWLLLRSVELAAGVAPVFFQQLASAAKTMAATVAAELQSVALPGFSAAKAYIAEICQGKTASLFAVSLFGAALLHPESDALHAPEWAAVGNQIGCTYQLLDDCLDVYAPKGSLNKSTGVDLRQGRLTLPLLVALQTLQSAGQGIGIDRFRTAHLTKAELNMLESTLAGDTVRNQLEEQVRKQIRLIEKRAQSTSIPSLAVLAVLSYMEAKTRLCFCDREGKTALTQRIHAA